MYNRNPHVSFTPRRQIRKVKRTRRRVAIGILCVMVACICYVQFFSSGETPSIIKIQPKTTLAKNIQLAWPVVGQAAVGTVDDGLLARSSDGESPMPTASMAKVIAALAIMEKQPFSQGQSGQTYTLTLQDEANYHSEIARGGSAVPVYEGMEVSEYQALQMMLIASANNMADTLTEKVFGSEEAYVSYAQDMVERMGLRQTTIHDASGFNVATASTPSELIAVGTAALKNPVIAEIVSLPQAWIPGVGAIKNTNELLGANGIIGIKTGTTDAAGYCLLFAADYTTKNGRNTTIVGVIMGDGSSASLFDDAKKLLLSTEAGLDPQRAD